MFEPKKKIIFVSFIFSNVGASDEERRDLERAEREREGSEEAKKVNKLQITDY